MWLLSGRAISPKTVAAVPGTPYVGHPTKLPIKPNSHRSFSRVSLFTFTSPGGYPPVPFIQTIPHLRPLRPLPPFGPAKAPTISSKSTPATRYTSIRIFNIGRYPCPAPHPTAFPLTTKKRRAHARRFLHSRYALFSTAVRSFSPAARAAPQGCLCLSTAACIGPPKSPVHWSCRYGSPPPLWHCRPIPAPPRPPERRYH